MDKSDLLESAQNGDASAQLQLGHLFEGKGIDQDFQQAFKWFQKAAKQGLAEAQWICGMNYRSGRGVAKDDHEAFKWISKAAKQGYPLGQFWLGIMLDSGRGVERDSRQSLKWFKRAAESGDEAALLLLGCSYEDAGCFRKAIRWTRRAAELGDSIGQYNLGLMYLKGHGVAKDYIEAYKWFILAGDHEPTAGSTTEDVEREMILDRREKCREAIGRIKTLVTSERCLQSIIGKAERRAKEFKPRSQGKMTGVDSLGLWIRSLPFWRPESGVEIIRTFWMLFCLLGSLFLLIRFVGEYKTQAVTNLGYGAICMGLMSVIGVMILGISKGLRKLQT